MTRFDAIIAGAGPAGTLTALLAAAGGRSAVVAEVRGMQGLRTNLARFSGDSQQAIRRAGAGAVFPPYEPRIGPRSFVVPIRDVEDDLRTTAAANGIPVHYESRISDVLQDPDGGIRATIRTPDGPVDVEAPVLIDATGGRFAGELDDALRLRPAGGEGHAIGLQWEHGTPVAGWNDAAKAGRGEVPGLRVDLGDGMFAGHHDAVRGTFGVIELPARPAPADQDRLVRELGRALGLGGHPELRYDFAISNQIAQQASAGSIALVGDSVTRLRPRTGQGVNLALSDAQDAARLIDDLARLDLTQAPAMVRMQRTRHLQSFGAAVMRRHKGALQSEQAPSPFAKASAAR